MSNWTVSGSAGGVVRYWTVQLVAEGFA
jgi:hypothetical protein